LLPIGFVVLISAVAVAKGLRGEPSVEDFIKRYPGTIESSRPDATTGFPAWARWQHFFNVFFMVFIVRSGVQILSDHLRLYWTRHSTPGKDCFRIQKPVPSDPLWTAKQDSISLPCQVGLPGFATRSAWLAGGTSASTRSGCSRRDLHCPGVRDRPVGAPGSHQLGRFP
jgi:sulfoxide reductase catalytic subunit YedY